MAEQMLAAGDAAYGLRYAAFRYFNVAGATERCGEDHRPETHVIPVALQALLGKRERFQVYGTDYPTPDGTAIRDYVHVIDLADAHILALGALSNGDWSLGPMNLGTADGFSVRQIVDAVERVTGRPLAGCLRTERRRGRPAARWSPTRPRPRRCSAGSRPARPSTRWSAAPGSGTSATPTAMKPHEDASGATVPTWPIRS